MTRAPSDLRWRRSRHDLDRLIDVLFGLLNDDRFEAGVYHAHGCDFMPGGNVDTSDMDRTILAAHARLVHSVAELMAVRTKVECELLEHSDSELLEAVENTMSAVRWWLASLERDK